MPPAAKERLTALDADDWQEPWASSTCSHAWPHGVADGWQRNICGKQQQWVPLKHECGRQCNGVEVGRGGRTFAVVVSQEHEQDILEQHCRGQCGSGWRWVVPGEHGMHATQTPRE